MFCIYKMKVKLEENHRPTQAREIEFITNAVSLTCAVFSHQCSSVYSAVQSFVEQSGRSACRFWICVYINCHILGRLKTWHFFPQSSVNSNSLHLRKPYLNDLLYTLPTAQCSGSHRGLGWFEEGDSDNRKLFSLWNAKKSWLGRYALEPSLPSALLKDQWRMIK